MMDWKS